MASWHAGLSEIACSFTRQSLQQPGQFVRSEQRNTGQLAGRCQRDFREMGIGVEFLRCEQRDVGQLADRFW